MRLVVGHYSRKNFILIGALLVALQVTGSDHASTMLNLSRATVVVRAGKLPAAEQTAARVLVEEVKKRTGLTWPITTNWPIQGPVVAIWSGEGMGRWLISTREVKGSKLPEHRPEGFRLLAGKSDDKQAVVWIQGADSHGTLFGVGQFLRQLEWAKRSATFPESLEIATAPAQPIRGHQLGYRATANSYDGWDDKQFEQYIRELALFGANSIETIPFQDERKSPHMPLPRELMNRKISEICARYELEYWIWTPADFDLKETAKRDELLKKHEALFRDCARFDGLFFPGGDPGDNPPEVVIPFLEELARILAPSHPAAKIWLSVQGFNKQRVDYVYNWIQQKQPDWLGGLVGGPSSPPVWEMRAHLPQRYGLRDYPDITHSVRCQYPTFWWDQAFALTLGREAANPRPTFCKLIQNYVGPFTSGFISYSDGAHDDVNKTLWSRLAWQPDVNPREVLLEYTRFFFGPGVAGAAADGILALEKNWEGVLADNGGVDATLELWQSLERKAPSLSANWRWQLCLLRAYYDAYTRHRGIYEAELERAANGILSEAPTRGAGPAMEVASAVLRRAVSQPIKTQWRARIEQLCGDLFRSVRLQTSVPRYQASGRERGAVLDFVDHPLNNRWWLEDEFARIRKLPSEEEKVKELERIASWENPGPGSFYDEVGNVGKSFHVVREGLNIDPLMEKIPNPGFWWWNDGSSRRRLSWQTSLDFPLTLIYKQLDPNATYRVRMTGYGEARLRLNGELASASLYGKDIGQFKEFPVRPSSIQDGKLKLSFEALDESNLNWRQQSRVSEVWLLKEPAAPRPTAD